MGLGLKASLARVVELGRRPAAPPGGRAAGTAPGRSWGVASAPARPPECRAPGHHGLAERLGAVVHERSRSAAFAAHIVCMAIRRPVRADVVEHCDSVESSAEPTDVDSPSRADAGNRPHIMAVEPSHIVSDRRGARNHHSSDDRLLPFPVLRPAGPRRQMPWSRRRPAPRGVVFDLVSFWLGSSGCLASLSAS